MIPDVPTHPAHLIISLLDPESRTWKMLKEVNLPENPMISGQGLSEDMPIDQMEAYMKAAMAGSLYQIEMDGLVTDHLRVECDREHPVWPCHGEMNGGPYNVPFAILNPLRAYGERISPVVHPVYHSVLQKKGIHPVPPPGMNVVDKPDMLLFASETLSIGFSLRRPMLMHLGWDAYHMGRVMENRLKVSFGIDHLSSNAVFTSPAGLSGPVIRLLSGDYGAHAWTGEVSVQDNKVMYRNLHVIKGFLIDVTFTVKQEQVAIDMKLNCTEELTALEFEIWRLAWDLKKAITGAAGQPTLIPGRNGEVCFPMLWASDGVGCLICDELTKSNTRLQVESYRRNNTLTGGFILHQVTGLNTCPTIKRGTYESSIILKVIKLGPSKIDQMSQIGWGTYSRWSAPFACFRPELGGFSDHSASVNCHMSQDSSIEVVAFTEEISGGPDLLELARFTIGRGLLEGGGYGFVRSLFHDSDPGLISAAGRIHQVKPDMNWMKKIEPGLVQATERMLDSLNDDGLVECRSLSGNSGSYRWSSNAMDVVGFGHLDAYSNALSYRAFFNAAALLKDLGQVKLSRRCVTAANGIHRAYADTFVNPVTGWVAGWKSRDGELHDYAFLRVNGPAIAFSLLDQPQAHQALRNLEQLRKKMGLDSARLGLPSNLISIRDEDHMLPQIMGRNMQTFENYTNGALSGVFANYYLRALAIQGFHEEAKKLAQELDDAFCCGIFDGGNHTGKEFHTWEGMAIGYEGTMYSSFGSLYAIAIEQGVICPPDPEWWPAGAED